MPVNQSADVVFSNDGPLGRMEAQFNRLPAILSGIWQDLNFLGNQAPSPSPTISTALRLVTSPLVFSKIYCPAALFFLGLCAWYCFRRLGFAPVPCALGALAAMLNSSFFSAAAWGIAGHTMLVGTVFLAIGLLGDAGGSHRWLRVVLAGFAVGLGVMEGFDLGALFSLVVAAFVAYQALISEGPMPRKIARGMLSLGVVAVCAAVLAAHALSGLISTQIKGVAGAGQDTQSKQQRWDWVPAGEKEGEEFAPALTQLLMLRVTGAATRGCVSSGAGLLSRGGGEESSPAPSERNAKHEHNGKPHRHWMTRNRSATHEQHRQADQIPGSTAGMENRITSGMSHTRHHATVRNTGSGSRLLESAYRDTSLLQF